MLINKINLLGSITKLRNITMIEDNPAFNKAAQRIRDDEALLQKAVAPINDAIKELPSLVDNKVLDSIHVVAARQQEIMAPALDAMNSMREKLRDYPF